MTSENTPDAIFNAQRDAYLEILKPVFIPSVPFRDDVIRYFASLLRVLGAEDRGWDPYGESEGTLNDINRLMKLSLPADQFPDADATVWLADADDSNRRHYGGADHAAGAVVRSSGKSVLAEARSRCGFRRSGPCAAASGALGA